MKILLTGVTGCLGSRLLPYLIEQGHEVFCLLRRPNCLKNVIAAHLKKIHVIICDLSKKEPDIPKDIDSAYYLIHSMKEPSESFENIEILSANNFLKALTKTNTKQIIYLGGLVTSHKLSPHLGSRQNVEKVLSSKKIPLTAFRAGIIIGSSSASFEIIRDLSEKLPFMIAPKWVESLCQPIGIDDALFYLTNALGKKECYDRTFDIGGPDIMTYHQILKAYSKKRRLKRFILKIPILTPRLSSLWLYFITSTNFFLAKALIESVKNNAICTEQSIHIIIPHDCISFNQSLDRALQPIAQTAFFTNLEEAKVLIKEKPALIDLIKVPDHGCFSITQEIPSSFKTLEFYKSRYLGWTLIKDSLNNLIFYKQNNGEYWVELLLKERAIEGKLWHRPRGLYQRMKWKFFSFTQKKFLKDVLAQTSPERPLFHGL